MRLVRIAPGLVASSLLCVFHSSVARADEPAPTSRADESPPKGVDDDPAKAAAKPEDEVRVVGPKLSQTAGSVHVIGEKQLQRFLHDDPHKVLLSVPGVYVRQEDGMGLRPNIGIRGANSDRSKKITLMEDGILFGPAPYSAPAAYYFPLITRMQSVRVVKGPGSVVYGPQTVGGAIDFVTREIPTSRKGTVDVGTGEYGYMKFHGTYGASDANSGFLLEGVHLENSGFKHIDYSGEDTGATRNEWMGKARYTVDPEAEVLNEFGVKLGYSDETSNETYLGLTDEDFRSSPYRRYQSTRDNRMESHRTQVEVSHRAVFSPRFELKTTAYRHDIHRVWRKVNGLRGANIDEVLASPRTGRNAIYYGVLNGSVDSSNADEAILVGPNDRRFVSQGIQTIAVYKPRTGPIEHRIEYGLRFHYDEIKRLHTQDGFLTQAGQLVPDGRVTEVTAKNLAYTTALALHAQDSLQWGNLALSPGARVEFIQPRYDDYLANTHTGASYAVLIPGVGAYYGLTRSLGVLAGVSRGFSPAPPEQASSQRPELSVNYEGGVRFTRRKLRAEIIGFFNDYQNLTNLCTESNGCSAANLDKQFSAGKARVYGAEVFAETEAALGDDWTLPVRATYTYTKTEFLNDFTSADPQFGNVRRGDELPYVPWHQVSGMIGVERVRYGVDVSGTFVDQMRESAGQGTLDPAKTTDAYFLLDASAFYQVMPWLRVYGTGKNLLDDAYLVSRRPFGARPGAPRWLQVGLKAEF